MSLKESLSEKNDLNLQPKHDVIVRKNGSKRVSIDVSHPQITDQGMKKATDINNILKQYAAGGIAPQPITDSAFYRDNSNVPDIVTAFNRVNAALDAFHTLPADVRKLMDNDPSKLESFISDVNNRDFLISRGVLTASPPVEAGANQKSSKPIPSEASPTPKSEDKSQV